jgi:hypothetical protein
MGHSYGDGPNSIYQPKVQVDVMKIRHELSDRGSAGRNETVDFHNSIRRDAQTLPPPILAPSAVQRLTADSTLSTLISTFIKAEEVVKRRHSIAHLNAYVGVWHSPNRHKLISNDLYKYRNMTKM